MSLRGSIRSFLVIAVLTVVAAATIPAPSVPINVRWTPDTTDAARRSLEQTFHLRAGERREGTTWRYDLDDTSFANIRQLVRHPAVDDTANLNRRFFRPPFAADRTAHVVMAGGLLALAALAVGLRQPRVSTAASVRLSPATVARTMAIAPLVVIGGALCALILGAVGVPTIWRSVEVSPAQAALAADVGTIYRVVTGGADPNGRYPVRLQPGAPEVSLSLLEAAVESKEPEVVTLVRSLGGTVNDGNRAVLVCLARAVGADAVVASLAPASSAAVSCDGVVLPPH